MYQIIIFGALAVPVDDTITSRISRIARNLDDKDIIVFSPLQIFVGLLYEESYFKMRKKKRKNGEYLKFATCNRERCLVPQISPNNL